MVVSLQVSAKGPPNCPVGRRPVSHRLVCDIWPHTEGSMRMADLETRQLWSLFRRQNLSWPTVPGPRDRRPRPLLCAGRRHCGFEGRQCEQDVTWRTIFFLLPLLFFLLGACERMKRIKEKGQKGHLGSLWRSSAENPVISGLGWDHLSLSQNRRCTWLGCGQTAQQLCKCSSDWVYHQRHAGKPTPRWLSFID